jgi:hypothetical protein
MESLADWALFAQLAPLGSFVYANEIVSGYRVGHDGNKFRKRLGMWIRDEVRMFTEVLPRSAGLAGMNTPAQLAWIGEASRDNFLRYLDAASKEFSLEERAEIAPLFLAWATLAGREADLRAFTAGETVRRPFNLRQRAKSMLRPVAQNLAALLHGR